MRLGDPRTYTTLRKFGSKKEINAAFHHKRHELLPLLNLKGADGKLDAYMHADAKGGRIGTISRKGTSGLDAHGRPVMFIDITLTLPNGTEVAVLKDGQAVGEAPDADSDAEPDAATDTGAGAATPLPSVTLPRPKPRDEFLPLHDIIGRLPADGFAVVTVLALGAAVEYNQQMCVPMRVHIQGGHREGEATALARGELYDCAKDVHAENCTFLVTATPKAGERGRLVDPTDVWWAAPHEKKGVYGALPLLSHQMANPPEVRTIVALKKIHNKRRDGFLVPIVKMSDGKAFAFKAPQSIGKWGLSEGSKFPVVLNTKSWKVTPVA